MKKTIQYIFIITLVILAYQFTKNPNEEDSTGSLSWHVNFDNVLEEAQKSGKPILINFTGSDWCPYCIKLDEEVFAKKPFEDWAAKNAILFRCDFPRTIHQPDSIKQQNNSLAQKYGISGFPTVLLIDFKGNVLAKSGYQRGGSASWVASLNSQVQTKD